MHLLTNFLPVCELWLGQFWVQYVANTYMLPTTFFYKMSTIKFPVRWYKKRFRQNKNLFWSQKCTRKCCLSRAKIWRHMLRTNITKILSISPTDSWHHQYILDITSTFPGSKIFSLQALWSQVLTQSLGRYLALGGKRLNLQTETSVQSKIVIIHRWYLGQYQSCFISVLPLRILWGTSWHLMMSQIYHSI